MRLRNNIFAAAFDYLKREKGIKTQKQLAKLMDVSEDTITRILKDRTEVTEDIITKLQTASGCIFNLQWLRGEDAFNMLAIDAAEAKIEKEKKTNESNITDTALSAYKQLTDSLTAQLRSKEAEMYDRLADKDKIIQSMEAQLKDKEEVIFQLRKEISELYRKINAGVGINYTFPIGVADEKKIR
jgi:plasmid maintenance system antidote protein VapI